MNADDKKGGTADVDQRDVDQSPVLMNSEVIGRAKGGIARAQKLSAEERKAIARKGASARWLGDIPEATHEGEFPLGEKTVSAAVLKDGRRIITQATFLRLLGRARSPKAGTGVLSTADALPFFLKADTLQPLISDELRSSTKPIFYRTKSGGKGVGYDANLLPKTCEVYLKLRDQSIANSGKQPDRYKDIITASDIVMRALAHVGIAALVDEATGYQEVRDRKALQEILNQYIDAELAKWASRFSSEFYQQMCRLKGLHYNPHSSKRPYILAKITIDVVYDRIGPGLTEELKRKKAEQLARGGKNHRLHQWLTEEIGIPALDFHLKGVTFLARGFGDGDWNAFHQALDRAVPAYNRTLMLDFGDENTTTSSVPQPLSSQSPSA